MAARLHILRTLTQRRDDDTRAEFAGFLRALRLPEDVKADMLRTVERHVPSTPEESTFLMLSPHQFVAVSRWLRQNSTRPVQAVALWNELFPVLDGKSGEIMATRAELAKLVGCRPDHLSGIMIELERIGAISRKREGRGVRYFMNPNVATSLPKEKRKRAQAAAPELRLVE